jgi:hypothetical protein
VTLTLSDTLRQNLRAGVVGRTVERDVFARALCADALPFHVIHVHGPGGVGKTTLLHEFEALAADAGVPATLLDLRDVDTTPDGLHLAIEAAFARTNAAFTPRPDGRHVLLLDTFEAAQEVDGWLQRVFLPQQPASLLVVLAGRYAPAPAWTADAAWAAAVCVMPLGNLSPDETEAFLDRRDVPAADRAGVAAVTHGYPLALALVAEHLRQRPGARFTLAEAPDVVQTLLERFVRDVPSPRHRTAIEGAAIVRSVSEPLLAALLAPAPAPRTAAPPAPPAVDAPEDAPDGAEPDRATAVSQEPPPADAPQAPDDVRAVFDWLRNLTFVDSSPRGLVLHDVARAAIEADLHWRDPARYADVHARIRRHYTSQLLLPGAEPALVLGDYVHLYRNNPVVEPLIGSLAGAWRNADLRPARPMHAGDVPALVEMVRAHEGDASAVLAAHWFAVQPEATEVFDSAQGAPAGFLTALALDEAAPADRDADALAAAAWAAVERTRRPGERVLLFRFWMDADAHQGLSAVQSLVFARTVRHYLTTPRLAVSLLPVADAELWGPVLAFAGLARWPEATATVGDRTVAVFGMDWRAVPPAAWLDALAARVPTDIPAPPERAPAEGRAVLSHDAFADAVRDALRDLTRPHRLASNPLLRTALVEATAGADATPAERAAALVGHITRAAETLRAAPRDVPLWNALRLTYLTPAPSQAIAAERLDVPFSSYRRHLVRGVAHVAETLWREEAGG